MRAASRRLTGSGAHVNAVKTKAGVAKAWVSSRPILSGLITAFMRQPVSMFAKQAAYSLLYALPAAVALLVALAALVDRLTGASLSTALQRIIEERAPAELEPLLESLVQNAIKEQSSSTALIGVVVAFGIALWGGASGANALVYASNRAYSVVDRRSYVDRKLLTFGLTLACGAIVIVAFILLLVGEYLAEWLAESTGRSSRIVQLLESSPILAGVLVFIAVAILYWVAPDVPHTFQWVLPGTALVTVATMVAFYCFDFLVRLVNPGSAFGAAGSVLALLWLLYLESAIVVVGAILNAVLSGQYDQRMIAYLEEHPDRRLPELA
jgi:membrane protein